jgi:small subunit ribosomal protein S17
MSGKRRRLVGKVVSNKMQKTVVVLVERTERHRLYEVISHKRRYTAHDEANACKIGDTVQIVEARPMSREKRWAVEEVLSPGSKSAGAAA